MCGIIGCLKRNLKINIIELIFNGLNLLKNRGYDSCGIFLNNSFEDFYLSKFGVDNNINNNIFDLLHNDINNLENKELYMSGIAHTRWSTHGEKTNNNSHPHLSNNRKICLIHNGIISNYDILKSKYLENYNFSSSTDSEVIVGLIQYFTEHEYKLNNLEIINKVNNLLYGTWACLICFVDEPNKIYFMKNESPLLIAKNNDMIIFTSETSGFMNLMEEYITLKDKSYGYFDLHSDVIYGGSETHKITHRNSKNDIVLDKIYTHWMRKEINDLVNINMNNMNNILYDPVSNKFRYENNNINMNITFDIRKKKYLYIIACGSSYYAGLLASNYFRYLRAFNFVNLFDAGDFNNIHLNAIDNLEELLIIVISQSGETRDLVVCINNIREYNKEIKIVGIINVIGSLISRLTDYNIYTNSGRENAVASTKSCISQSIACNLLAIYKAKMDDKLESKDNIKFGYNLLRLHDDIMDTIKLEERIVGISKKILLLNPKSIFILGKDELFASALEGALKIKEITYIHAEGFVMSALKHGPYALIEKDTPVILLYKKKDHIVKSISQELITRGAYLIEITNDNEKIENDILNIINIPDNKIFTGVLHMIVLQLLSYNMSILKNINPDMPRNLAKVVTVD
jgi:glucosamine--fructose-6-phosphate aminotransferase (isomerizing)